MMERFDLAHFQTVNAQRAERWHQGNLQQWTLLEWAGAMAGESGEACNVAKKLRRIALHLPNKEAGLSTDDIAKLKAKLAQEVADTVIYGLIILSILGEDAGQMIADVFDAKSIEYGFPERARLPLPPSVERAANVFADRVAVSQRFHGEIYLGKDEYSTITDVVRAAYVAGAIANGHQ